MEIQSSADKTSFECISFLISFNICHLSPLALFLVPEDVHRVRACGLGTHCWCGGLQCYAISPAIISRHFRRILVHPFTWPILCLFVAKCAKCLIGNFYLRSPNPSPPFHLGNCMINLPLPTSPTIQIAFHTEFHYFKKIPTLYHIKFYRDCSVFSLPVSVPTFPRKGVTISRNLSPQKIKLKLKRPKKIPCQENQTSQPSKEM